MKTGALLMKKKEARAGFLFLLPLLAGLIVFYVMAFIQNFYFSFTELGSFGGPTYVGTDNYGRLVRDPKFYRSLVNTLQFVVISVPSVVVLATAAALALNRLTRSASFFRTALFLPAITMPAAIGLLWRWLYNYEFGIINVILGWFGFKGVAWLSEPSMVVLSISIVLIWTMVSTQMIIVLAGLQGISRTYFEAARIDGASYRQVVFRIILPLLSPTLFFVTIITTINVFQIFDFIFLMIRPTVLAYQYSQSLVSYFFDRAFVAFEKGYAASVSMVLFLIIFIITVIQFRLQKKWVHYG